MAMNFSAKLCRGSERKIHSWIELTQVRLRTRSRLYTLLALLASCALLVLVCWKRQSISDLFKSDFDRTPDEVLDKLFTEHKVSISTSDKSCPGYWELRDVNFFHPTLNQRLCKNIAAYTMIDNKFPVCEITENLPTQLVNRVKETAIKGYIISVLTKRNVTIYTYPAEDIVSGHILSSKHNWEPDQVALTLSFAQKFPIGSVTFMDIGCNIGAYSLQARDAGIPTVAVDANIRNLIRIRMSANDMNWGSDNKLKLMWMYFHSSVSLQYLNFGTKWCNVDGATSSKDSITDTIPVMTGRADDLVSSVTTDLVVMKIDIEASEHIFFSTGEQLFNDKKIIAVQMDFWRADFGPKSSSSPNFGKIMGFLVRRNYSLYSAQQPIQPLNIDTLTAWDVIWIRNDFKSIMIDNIRKEKI